MRATFNNNSARVHPGTCAKLTGGLVRRVYATIIHRHAPAAPCLRLNYMHRLGPRGGTIRYDDAFAKAPLDALVGDPNVLMMPLGDWAAITKQALARPLCRRPKFILLLQVGARARRPSWPTRPHGAPARDAV